jgi:ferritin-like metal-binding protein YciE
MDARPQALAEEVRAKRVAIDNDLELLRVRMQQASPRRLVDARWLKTAAPVAAGLAAALWWVRRRRSVTSLEELLIKQLSDLYATEQELLPALARMSVKATNPELKQAFDQHRIETAGHVERLDRVFRSIGARPKRGASDAVAGVVAETERLLGRKVDPEVRDAWLIASAQRVEHIEIANYGTARTFAETLAYTHAAQLLQQTLEEERRADETLTHLAERFVNPQSIRGPGRAGWRRRS